MQLQEEVFSAAQEIKVKTENDIQEMRISAAHNSDSVASLLVHVVAAHSLEIPDFFDERRTLK